MMECLFKEPVTCTYCGSTICGCSVCQAFCTCIGFWEDVMVPYMEEQARIGPN